jgi:hypothetical protein
VALGKTNSEDDSIYTFVLALDESEHPAVSEFADNLEAKKIALPNGAAIGNVRERKRRLAFLQVCGDVRSGE